MKVRAVDGGLLWTVGDDHAERFYLLLILHRALLLLLVCLFVPAPTDPAAALSAV